MKGEKVLIKRTKNYSKTTSYYNNQPYTNVDNHRYSVKVINSQGKTFIRNKAHIKKYFESNNKPNEYNKTSSIHDSTSKHELPSPLATLVPNPPHENDEITISDNESNTSESAVPYITAVMARNYTF